MSLQGTLQAAIETALSLEDDLGFNGTIIAAAQDLEIGDDTFNGSCIALAAALDEDITTASEALNYLLANPTDVAGLFDE